MSHICIIEDDAAIAEIERDYLEINGFTVSIATDGVSGLNLTQTESFDLILLDLMLPQLDGFTLCRKLRERLDIPILMVTAKKEDIDKIRGLGLGADDYIVKPFSPGELVARVQAHIATYKRLKTPQETQQEITVGAIRICPKSHRVFVREQEVSLKNKEYELLVTSPVPVQSQHAVVVRRTIHMDKRTLFLPDQLFSKVSLHFPLLLF